MKKIYPTLWWLFRDNLLPKETTFIGYARSNFTLKELRKKCHSYMKVRSFEEEKYEEFWQLNHYVRGMYDSKNDFDKLDEEIQKHERGTVSNRLFYLALPPTVFHDVTTHIRNTCMGKK